MLTRVSISLAFLVAMPAWPQVAPSATGGDSVSDSSAQMKTPPPVSGETYVTTVGSDERSNFLGFGVTASPAYDDNILTGNSAKPIADVNYMFSPSLAFDRTASRQHESLSYNPAFNLYQKTSALNSIGQSAALAYRYRLSPGVTFDCGDTFLQTSNVFNQSPIFAGTGISGSTQNPAATAIAPFAEQRSNTVHGGANYQFSRDGMIGGAANFSTYTFPNPPQATGLYNSQTTSGSAFYARRLTERQYAGAGYQYARVLTQVPGVPIETQIHSIAPYYTFSLRSQFSFSLSGGMLHYSSSEPGKATTASWSPIASASFGWQRSMSAFAASFFRIVSAGQGLQGAFSSTSVNGSGNWRLGHTWGAGLTMSYSRTHSAASALSTASSNGETLSAGLTLQRSLTERLSASFGYQRLHQNYSAIAAIAGDPDSDREYGSVTYQLSRPLGR